MKRYLSFILIYCACTGAAFPQQTDPPAPNHLTILEFHEPVTMAAAGSSDFQIERQENKVFVKPMKSGASTDLFVWTASRRFAYELETTQEVKSKNFAIDNAPSPAAHLVVSPSTDQLADLMLTRAFLGTVEITSVNTPALKEPSRRPRRASVPNQEQCLYPLHDREQQQELLPRCSHERIPGSRGSFVHFLVEPCTQAARSALIGKTCQHPKCFSSYCSCGKRCRRSGTRRGNSGSRN